MCHGQIIGDALLRAQRMHKTKCDHCGKEIKVGEEFRRGFRKDGREAIGYKLHLRCNAMALASIEHDPDYCSWNPRDDAKEESRLRGWKNMRATVRRYMDTIRGQFRSKR